MEKPADSDDVSEGKHGHGNSVASLQRVDKLIIYITMYKQKAPICKLSCRKA